MSADLWKDAEVIHTYTRAQAIDDGVLVDVGEAARVAGVKFPVALTAGVWSLVENIPKKWQGIQDVAGRLWNVVWMLRCAIGRARGSEIRYKLILHHAPSEGAPGWKYVTLKALCGPGDAGEPVITVMLPHED